MQPRPSKRPPRPSQQPCAMATASASEPHVPRTTVIFSFGHHSHSGQSLLNELQDVDAYIVDCRETLKKDPMSTVSHHEDGSFENTQQVVFEQSGWPKLMEDLVMSAASHKIIAIGCKAGIHRANTCGRALEDALNMLFDENNQRLFNAKHFALGTAHGAKGVAKVMRDAWSWHDDAWVVIEGDRKPLNQRYGYTAAMGSASSAKNWKEFHKFIDHLQEHNDSIIAGTAQEVEHYEPPEQEVTKDEVVDMKSPSVEHEQEHSAPRTPAEPPRTARSRSPPHIPLHEQWFPTPHPPQDPPPGWHEQQEQQQEQHEEVVEDEDHVTFEQNPQAWNKILKHNSVDLVARQELFLLAQHSQAGWEHANTIVGKLLKKQADNERLGNASGFVHRCVHNARGRMWSHGASST